MLRIDYKITFISIVFIAVWLSACPAGSAEVIILGDPKLKPVSDLIAGIEKTLAYKTTVKLPEDVKNNLEGIVYKEGAKAVVALGKDAVDISLSLPESIPVIYGLTIHPLQTERRNITGIYMATPVEEYIAFIKKYLPGIKKIGIICEPPAHDSFCPVITLPDVVHYTAANPYEFIERINLFRNNIDALLLLPQRNLISNKALEEVYLFSFKQKIPVIGLSEKYVKIGSLFALGFDSENMGMQIGNAVKAALSRGRADMPSAPPEKFNLYINRKTAETLGINIPPKLYEQAERVYP